MKKLIGILVVLVMALSLPVAVGAQTYDCICGEDCMNLTSSAELPADVELLDPALVNAPDGLFALVHGVCFYLTGDGDGEAFPTMTQGLLDFIGDEDFDAILPIGETNGSITDSTWVSFSSGSLNPDDIVNIMRYRPGNSWLNIGEAVFQNGFWRFQVTDPADFGQALLFFALVERLVRDGLPPAQAVEIAADAVEQAVVLGEVSVSPDTSDSSIGMFGMLAIMLSALGIAAFAIRKATKEMAK